MASTSTARGTAKRPRRSQAERSESTIKELVSTARDLFAEKGFTETSIEDMVRAAGVTRGALYHHFDSKTEVFKAVFEEEARGLAERTSAAALRRRDAWKQVEAGCLAFFDECVDPGLQQIILVDGPAVLGWDGLREIESRYTMAALRIGLEKARAEGRLKRRNPEVLARLLFGAMCEVAMLAARDGGDGGVAMRDGRRELQALLRSISDG